MTKKEMILERAKIAGYENDQQVYARLLIENARVGTQNIHNAFSAGARLKAQEAI